MLSNRFQNSIHLQRGLAFGAILSIALIFFEAFNFSTTEFALADLLGDQAFVGIRWSVILAIAFCGIDFAGIARIFTPEQGKEEPAEIWYLFGAWLLAAAMNAMLTWWGVSISLLNHATLGSAVVPHATLLKFVPIFAAVMVWLTRILLIGSFSVAGERIFSLAQVGRSAKSAIRTERRQSPSLEQTRPQAPVRTNSRQQPLPTLVPRPASGFRPAPKPEPSAQPLEPSFHPVGKKSNDSGSRTTNFR